jgi:uncharacterized protein
MFGYFLAEGAYNPKEPQPTSRLEELKWLNFGAENNVATAAVTLGAMYHDGDGVPQDFTKAAKLFDVAAHQDLQWATSNISVHIGQSLLGDLYQSGRGIAKDVSQAANLYRSAADAGYSDAQYKMGVALVRGLGVARDYAEGVKYYRMAAEQGDKRAQSALGAMYFLGRGVPQDYIQAHLWSNLASTDGDAQMLKLRNELNRR